MASCKQCARWSSSNYNYCPYWDDDFATGILFDWYHGYEDARQCEGFSEGSDGCFLTTACVEYMGKADDCHELTTLRNFRDNFMRANQTLSELVDEYYRIAPQIVEEINKKPNKESYYKHIFAVVRRCVDLIANGKNNEAVLEYQDMVLTLKQEFAI